MRVVWMVLFMVLPVAGIAYVAWHVWTMLPLGTWWKTAVVAVGVLAFLMLFAGLSDMMNRLPLSFARIVYEIGTSSLIVLLYLFMLFLLVDAARLLHIIPRQLFCHSWAATAAVAALMVVLFVCANLHYRHKYRQPMELTTAKHIGRDYRFVMVSDLHLGYHNPRKELARWVDLLNAEHADAIFIAGDIIDISVRPLLEENMHEEFRRLNAPVYACLGNHEYYSGSPEAQRFMGDAGIRLLRDEAAVIDSVITVVGRDDRTNMRRAKLNDIMSGVDRADYIVVLDHQPYHLEESEQAGADLQFSGHTHHGQVWLVSWITERVYECAFGPYRRGATHYYVSSGLGIWGGKFRIGTRSEYVVAEIKQSSR